MLERYFVKPTTVDRIKGCWLGKAIEDYVQWMEKNRYATRSILRRVPLLVGLAQFAGQKGIKDIFKLHDILDDFIEVRVKRGPQRSKHRQDSLRKEIRGPISNFLEWHGSTCRGHICQSTVSFPFHEQTPGYREFLITVRGLSTSTIGLYRYYLSFFERYLKQINLEDLGLLTPMHLSAFVAAEGEWRSKKTMGLVCTAVRVFLRYLHMEGIHGEDMCNHVKRPRIYRKDYLPRSITWEEVKLVLDCIDRRTDVGARDYAILLLLLTYGLRAREVASLTLDDIDWKRDRLHITGRKADHNTTYPLSKTVGEAIVAYLKNGRPETHDRHLFMCCQVPLRPMQYATVAGRVTCRIRKAGITVRRPGSHTLRHTCVTRLIDQGFDLKVIGDYVGHSSTASTEIYAKISVEDLREVALSDGEDIL